MDMEMVLWCAVVVFVFCLIRLFAPLQEEDTGMENLLRGK